MDALLNQQHSGCMIGLLYCDGCFIHPTHFVKCTAGQIKFHVQVKLHKDEYIVDFLSYMKQDLYYNAVFKITFYKYQRGTVLKRNKISDHDASAQNRLTQTYE